MPDEQGPLWHTRWMSTALLYLRISVNRTSEHNSVQQQRDDCHALAQRLGYTRTLEFVDEAISAYQDRRRPAYQDLLRYLHHTPVTVIVWHIDRLYRRPDELEQLVDVLDTRPVRIESVQGGSFDLNTHEGRLFARQLVAFANYESAHKGARVARAQQHRTQQGLLHRGSHYGYLSDGNLHPKQGPTLRRIAEDYLTGLSISAIAHELTNAEISPPAGGRQWNSTTIASILNSQRLHGHNRLREGTWERVITSNESKLIRAIQLTPRRDATRSSVTLLGGIARCGICGNRLISTKASRRQLTYRCRTYPTSCQSISIGQKSLNEYVQDIAITQLREPAHLMAPLQDPASILEQLRDAQATLHDLARRYARYEISRISLMEARRPSEATIMSAGEELSRHLRLRVRDRYLSVPFAKISTPRQRTVVDSLLSAIEVHPATTTRDPASRVRVQLYG